MLNSIRRPFLIATAVNVVVTAIVLYLSLIATDENVFSTVLLGALAFTIGLVISAQIDSQIRTAEVKSVLDDKFGQLKVGQELLSAMATPDKLSDEYPRIIKASNLVITQYAKTIVDNECRRRIVEIREDVKHLSKGILLVDSFDASLKISLLATPRLQLCTTSKSSSDIDFYSDHDGEEYWKRQKQALAARSGSEGVSIERIFIWDRWSPELVALINEHRNAGVRVLLIEEAILPQPDRVDVTYWGNEYTFRQRYRERPEGSNKWFDRFSINYSDIRQAREQYARIREKAMVVEQPVSEAGPPTPSPSASH